MGARAGLCRYPKPPPLRDPGGASTGAVGRSPPPERWAMPGPSTAEQFLDLACKSGLLDRQDIEAYLQRQGATSPLADAPRALAEALVRDGLLTRFQAEHLL